MAPHRTVGLALALLWSALAYSPLRAPGDAILKEEAASALAQLAQRDPAAIGAADGVAPLLELLRPHAEGGDSVAELFGRGLGASALSAASVLRLLAAEDDLCRETIVAEEGVEVLCDLLVAAEGDLLSETCAALLQVRRRLPPFSCYFLP